MEVSSLLRSRILVYVLVKLYRRDAILNLQQVVNQQGSLLTTVQIGLSTKLYGSPGENLQVINLMITAISTALFVYFIRYRFFQK